MNHQFYHSFPEFNIVGNLSNTVLEHKWDSCKIPDLNNKTVLDIGAWSGWYSLRAAKYGASIVTAIDHNKRSETDIAKIIKLSGIHINTKTLDILDLNTIYNLGKFDIVFFFGVLYHMKHPLLALERCYSATKDLCIIESHVDDNLSYDHKHENYMRFIPDDSLNGDHTNWWSPSIQCVMDMCTTVGFSKVELINRHHNRGIFHAYV